MNTNMKNILAFSQMKNFAQNGHLICSSNEKVAPKELINSAEYINSIETSGFEVDITTLTQIKSKIVKQKFYEVAPANFIPMKIGVGAFMEELLTWKEFSISDDFESGNMDQGTNNTKIPTVDSTITAVKTKLVAWAKSIGYSLFEIQQASRTGNWSKIISLERSRKKNWDLGIQKIAFLGANADAGMTGLLNNASVTINTAIITKKISSMTDSEFQTFVSLVLGAYSTNANATAMPDTFAIPLSDWLGFGIATSASYPINSRIEYLENMFKRISGNPNFKMMPLAYGDVAHNNLGKTRYTLYKRSEDVLDMNLPIDYTTTSIGSANGFQFENIAYGQYSGVEVYRPAEMLYFDF